MLKHLKKEVWSPYVVGVFIAILAVSSLFVFQKTVGASTTFVKLAALFWSAVDPSHLEENPYYRTYLNGKGWFDWQMLFVLGIFLGAFLSSKFSGAVPRRKVPHIWEVNWGTSVIKRRTAAFMGGVILMFGARLAGGCTSGHAISGGFQLALSGWIFMMGVFALGIPTALMMYRKGRAL